MLFNGVKAVLVILTIYLHPTHGVVQFSFNKESLAISEGGNLSNELSILRNGQSENRTITFQVRVIPGTAVENLDYRPNSEFSYVFTSNTSQLPVRTELVGDRAGEPIETFAICLPDAEVLRSMGAEAVQPSCANITIVDDDSVVIGFKNSLEGVVEGGTTLVCVEVKPEGLRVDPFDRVPLSIRTNPASSEIQLNTSSVVFENSISENCSVMVTAANSENTNMGNRSYTLILERASEMSTVPVEVYPNITDILVIDDDTEELDTSFSIVSPRPNISVLEGGRVDGIKVKKLNNTVLTYNVSLALTGRPDDVVVSSYLIFDPSTTEEEVEVEILEDTMSETRKEFSITIDRAVVVGAPNVNFATAVGQPATIVVYDNDFEIGLSSNEFSVPEGSSNVDVCVEITKPVASRDIEPLLSIPITVTLKTSASSNISETLDRRNILLSATNKVVCVALSLNADNGTYFIQLTWTDDQAGYDVDFPSSGQNATINIIPPEGGPTPPDTSTGAIVGIVIALLIVIILIIVVIITIPRAIKLCRKVKEPAEAELSNVSSTQSSKESSPAAAPRSPTTTGTDSNNHDHSPSEYGLEGEQKHSPVNESPIAMDGLINASNNGGTNEKMDLAAVSENTEHQATVVGSHSPTIAVGESSDPAIIANGDKDNPEPMSEADTGL